jgi:hypothetical protein
MSLFGVVGGHGDGVAMLLFLISMLYIWSSACFVAFATFVSTVSVFIVVVGLRWVICHTLRRQVRWW